MKNLFKISVVIFLVGMLGCEKYKTQFEGPYSDATNPSTKPISYEIVFCKEGRLFMADKYVHFTKQFSIVQPIKKVSINDAHDRIAYKTSSGSITIIDTTGAEISVVPNSKTVEWFDFHANNQTLYMLENKKLTFFGPPVAVAATDLESALPWLSNDVQIPTAAVAADGSVVFG